MNKKQARQEAARGRGFFTAEIEGCDWAIIVPELVSALAYHNGERTARSMGLEDIFDAEDLADRKAEIRESHPADEYETAEERKAAIDADIADLDAEIRWNDKMIIVPVGKADGSVVRMAVVNNREAFTGAWHSSEDMSVADFKAYTGLRHVSEDMPIHIYTIFANAD